MKSVKLVGVTVLSSIFLMGMGAFVVSTQNALGPASLDLRQESGSRSLELGQAENQTKETDSEERVALNDPALSQAWGFKKSEAAAALRLSQGSEDIVVAVIDTGADINHEDLKENIWVNPNPVKGDIHGWNFVSNNNDLTDNHGHGTHIAGIIGARAGNGKGIAGISPKVKLMILKYFDPKVPATDNLKNTINAIYYAIENGAHIINYSGGGTEFSQEEKGAIDAARKKGILFVAAAGNERSNSDHHKYYPADYGLDNIISVTAIDPKAQVLASSNYGVETVDLAAPGQNILSTLPGDSYGYMTGTSQATAFVTGAAVLIKAVYPEFSANEMKKYILATGDAQESLLAKTRTARRLNLYKALTMLDASVTASGVALANAPRQRFTADASSGISGGGFEPTARIANFGRSLMQALGEQSAPSAPAPSAAPGRVGAERN